MDYQELTLDINKEPTVQPPVYLAQGDRQNALIGVKVRKNGEDYDLAGKSARLVLTNKGGGYYTANGTVSGSTATFQVDETTAAVTPGETLNNYVEVLQGTSVIASTQRFRLVVLPNGTEGADPNQAWTNGIEAAAQAALDAADAANQAAADALAAIDAMGDISELAIPLMDGNTRGGAKLGSGLKIDDGALCVDMDDGEMELKQQFGSDGFWLWFSTSNGFAQWHEAIAPCLVREPRGESGRAYKDDDGTVWVKLMPSTVKVYVAGDDESQELYAEWARFGSDMPSGLDGLTWVIDSGTQGNATKAHMTGTCAAHTAWWSALSSSEKALAEAALAKMCNQGFAFAKTGDESWGDEFQANDHVPASDTSGSFSRADVWYNPSTQQMVIKARLKFKETIVVDGSEVTTENYVKSVIGTGLRYIPLFKLVGNVWQTVNDRDGVHNTDNSVAYDDFNAAWGSYNDIRDAFAFWTPITVGGVGGRMLGNSYCGARFYGDGLFAMYTNPTNLYDDTGGNSRIIEADCSRIVNRGGTLSRFAKRDPDEICAAVCEWATGQVGMFAYEQYSNFRLDLQPDVPSPVPDRAARWFPAEDCSGFIWLAHALGAGVPLAVASSTKEMGLGEFVTFAEGGYWDEERGEYVPGERLDVSKMLPGDLVGFAAKSFGTYVWDEDYTAAHIDSNPDVSKDGEGHARYYDSGRPRLVTTQRDHAHWPPHYYATRSHYRPTALYGATADGPGGNVVLRDPTGKVALSFGHIALYLGDNKFIHMSGKTVAAYGFQTGQGIAAGTKSKYIAAATRADYRNDYTSGGEPVIDYDLTILAAPNANGKPDPYNWVTAYHGPYMFEGMDTYRKDWVSLSATPTSSSAQTSPSCDRVVVRLFPRTGARAVM